VSVVIPTFNRRRFIGSAIDSALAQTYAPIEIVVVDDGSTDGTAELIRERYAGDRRVQYHWQINQGQAIARNAAIREARGEVVAFLDSDDLWNPDKLEKQMPLMIRAPAVQIVHGGCSLVDESGRWVKDHVPARETGVNVGHILGALVYLNRISCLTAVVRKEAIERVGGFNPGARLAACALDWDLWLRIACHGSVDYIPETLAKYRVHPGNSEVPVPPSTYHRMLHTVLNHSRQEDRECVLRSGERRFRYMIAEAFHHRRVLQGVAAYLWGTWSLGGRLLVGDMRTLCWRATGGRRRLHE
jgi:glycosyltransferase involved in cell wall biosynthesis